MLECPSHALGIPCQFQRERQLRVKIVLYQDYAEGVWKPSPGMDWNQERFWENRQLDEGGVVGGVFVEVVGGFVDGLGTIGIPE
jgi:hypothetical protein